MYVFGKPRRVSLSMNSPLVEPYVEAVVDDERDDFVGHSLEAARPHEHRHELLTVRLRVGLDAAGVHYFL